VGKYIDCSLSLLSSIAICFQIYKNEILNKSHSNILTVIRLVFFRGLCWNDLLAHVSSHLQSDEQQENNILY
jgi:hypothetical protein